LFSGVFKKRCIGQREECPSFFGIIAALPSSGVIGRENIDRTDYYALGLTMNDGYTTFVC